MSKSWADVVGKHHEIERVENKKETIEEKYCDIGLNLCCKQFTGRYNEILKRAKEANVISAILTGSTYKTCINNLYEIHKDQPIKLFTTLGIHPHDAKEYKSEFIEFIEREVNRDRIEKHNKIVAIGETGLDYDRMFSTREQQILSFRNHIEISIKLDMPMFLHVRNSMDKNEIDAHDEFMEIIKEYKGKIRGVVHCFTGNAKQIKDYIDFGFYIGITGFIGDDRRNKPLLGALKSVDKDLLLSRLMIETDAPYLHYTAKRGVINEPNTMQNVCELLANELDIDKKLLMKITFENTVRLFNI